MAYLHTSLEHCHHCDSYQPFTWDMELIGRQIIRCPNCNHPHLRVIQRDERVRIAVAPKISARYFKDGDLPTEALSIETVAGISANSRFGSANHLNEQELQRIQDEINWERERDADLEAFEELKKNGPAILEAARNFNRGR